MTIAKMLGDNVGNDTPVAPDMFFTAVRVRDGKRFEGVVASVKYFKDKGTMVVLKSHATYSGAERGDFQYSSLYIDQCDDVLWSY